MDWKKAVFLGVGLWVAMFVIVSAFIAFMLYTPGQPNIIVAVVAGIISYVLAGFAKPKTLQNALQYGASWVVVGLVLDWLITTRFSSVIFQMWTLWLGYGLILLAPLLRTKKD